MQRITVEIQYDELEAASVLQHLVEMHADVSLGPRYNRLLTPKTADDGNGQVVARVPVLVEAATAGANGEATACPDCGQMVKRQGMGGHRRAHGRPSGRSVETRSMPCRTCGRIMAPKSMRQHLRKQHGLRMDGSAIPGLAGQGPRRKPTARAGRDFTTLQPDPRSRPEEEAAGG